MSTPFATKDRILNAAESLFAEHGFGGTSLRQVTGLAQVNIAAVNYHFGGKDNLINEVFRRRMDEMSERRLAALDTAMSSNPASIDRILAAFIEPALVMGQEDGRTGGAFIRVIARAYAERNDSLRQFLSERYGHVQRAFTSALAACMPSLERQTLYWRMDFLSGALTYAMADYGMIKRLPGTTDIEHRERAMRELIAFAAAGLQAGHTASAEQGTNDA